MTFFKKPSQGDASPSVGTPEGLKAKDVFVDIVAGQRAQIADLRRSTKVWQAVGATAVIGLVLTLPLRKEVPYFYEVDSSTGRVGLSDRASTQLKVSDQNVAYFLRLWTARLVTINAGTLREGLPSAYRWTRGAAQVELDTWTNDEDKTATRISRTPGLTREVLGVPTVSFNEDQTLAVIDFVWVEKVSGVEKDRRRKLLTLEFGVVPPKPGDRKRNPADDADNPLGIAITHFTINDQVAR